MNIALKLELDTNLWLLSQVGEFTLRYRKRIAVDRDNHGQPIGFQSPEWVVDIEGQHFRNFSLEEAVKEAVNNFYSLERKKYEDRG